MAISLVIGIAVVWRAFGGSGSGASPSPENVIEPGPPPAPSPQAPDGERPRLDARAEVTGWLACDDPDRGEHLWMLRVENPGPSSYWTHNSTTTLDARLGGGEGSLEGVHYSFTSSPKGGLQLLLNAEMNDVGKGTGTWKLDGGALSGTSSLRWFNDRPSSWQKEVLEGRLIGSKQDVELRLRRHFGQNPSIEAGYGILDKGEKGGYFPLPTHAPGPNILGQAFILPLRLEEWGEVVVYGEFDPKSGYKKGRWRARGADGEHGVFEFDALDR